ncbi:MAG: hypothetical protein AAF380_00070, partial [Bacteroidota bacterium]
VPLIILDVILSQLLNLNTNALIFINYIIYTIPLIIYLFYTQYKLINQVIGQITIRRFILYFIVLQCLFILLLVLLFLLVTGLIIGLLVWSISLFLPDPQLLALLLQHFLQGVTANNPL